MNKILVINKNVPASHVYIYIHHATRKNFLLSHINPTQQFHVQWHYLLVLFAASRTSFVFLSADASSLWSTIKGPVVTEPVMHNLWTWTAWWSLDHDRFSLPALVTAGWVHFRAIGVQGWSLTNDVRNVYLERTHFIQYDVQNKCINNTLMLEHW